MHNQVLASKNSPRQLEALVGFRTMEKDDRSNNSG
jgi:hypothetical protein